MPTIISTLTDSVDYTQYRAQAGGGTPEAIRHVTVKGGARLAQKRLLLLNEGPSSKNGVATEVTEDELEFLQGHPLFKTHVENGFIQVLKTVKVDAEKASKDMAKDTKSSQITDADLDEKNPEARLKGHKLKGATQ
jgi:hypothetical protein